MYKKIFFTFYSALWALALPILKKSKKLSEGYSERCGYMQTKEKYAESCDLMLVAASAGESFLALEILEELAKSGQDLNILITTWTRQGLDILNKNSQVIIEANPQIKLQIRFAFFDQPKIVRKVLQECTPKLIVLLETEIWFALLEQAKIQSIKVAIINARLSAKSLKSLTLLKKVLASPDCIMSISKLDQERFTSLFRDANFKLMSNIKFDRSYKALHNLTEENAEHKNMPTLGDELSQYQDYILLASVREEEELLLEKSLELLLEKKSQINIIIVPRHLPRVEAWRQSLQNKVRDNWADVQVILASSLHHLANSQHSLAPKNIIIWDRFGDLSALYQDAKAIYVGGSLVDLGGQNFLEAAGKKICVGKYLKNFDWAIDDELLSLGIVEIVEDEIALAHSLYSDYANRVNKQAEFFTWLAKKCGGTKQSVSYILEEISAKN